MTSMSHDVERIVAPLTSVRSYPNGEADPAARRGAAVFDPPPSRPRRDGEVGGHREADRHLGDRNRVHRDRLPEREPGEIRGREHMRERLEAHCACRDRGADEAAVRPPTAPPPAEERSADDPAEDE